MPYLVVFDLDGTLTRGDTYVRYLFGYLVRHPWRFVRALHLPWFVLQFYLGRISNTVLKEKFLSACLGGLERPVLLQWTQTFLDKLLAGGFREEGLMTLDRHRKQGDVLVLLTASLDLYVDEVGSRLGFHHVICTQVEWQGDKLSGRLSSPNRYGTEKVRCLQGLKEQYSGYTVIAYADDHSDIPLLQLADEGVLVNGKAGSCRLARQSGILERIWTS
jgi:HAD superfamily hydrolase (TIGR01490 family)